MTSQNLLNQPIYSNNIIHRIINIPFIDVQNYILKDYIQSYANKHIANKCHKEGYINDNISIINISGGRIKNDIIEYDVQFEVNVCLPYENMKLDVKIFNITKIGIRAVLNDNEDKNPIIVFANTIHNDIIENSNNNYKIGDIIKIKVLGSRFEINDKSIYVLGKII